MYRSMEGHYLNEIKNSNDLLELYTYIYMYVHTYILHVSIHIHICIYKCMYIGLWMVII
jgi:hypothetical protein